jgi:hypothetical protein
MVHGELDWLAVAGQDILCQPGEIWTTGHCELCEAGTFPNSRAEHCLPCPPGTYSDLAEREGHDGACSVCPDGTEPNEHNTACLPCPAGAAGVAGLCSACARGQVRAMTKAQNV